MWWSWYPTKRTITKKKGLFVHARADVESLSLRHLVLSIYRLNPGIGVRLATFDAVEFTADNNPLVGADWHPVVNRQIGGETSVIGQTGQSLQ